MALLPFRAMTYWEPEPRSRAELERQLGSDDPEAICHALIEAAYHEDDWRWVQSECSRLSHHPDEGVRNVAVLGLGHLARIHRQLDGAAAEEVLRRLADDPSARVAGTLSDVRSDFEVFLGRRFLAP